jgi:hypothetical protein
VSCGEGSSQGRAVAKSSSLFLSGQGCQGLIFEQLTLRLQDNFKPAIEKAKEACKNSGHAVADHFAEVRNIIKTGKF